MVGAGRSRKHAKANYQPSLYRNEMPTTSICIDWRARLSAGFVEGNEVTCLGEFGIVLEVGKMEDGFLEWLYVGLIGDKYEGKEEPYDFVWVPQEIVSHACVWDPTVNWFWFYLLKVSGHK